MNRTRLFYSTILAATVLFGSVTAHAGFEWKGPITPAPANFATEVPPVDGDYPVPVVEGGINMPAEKVGAVDTQQVPPPLPAAFEAPNAQDIVFDTPVNAMPEASGDIVSGFGSDLPLVIALQQIVPPGYQYSFLTGVNAGASASWEGGKPWQAVLTDMLARQGLGYHIKGNSIVIGYRQTPQQTPQMHANSGTEYIAPNMMGANEKSTPITMRRQKPSALLSKPNMTDRTQSQGMISDAPADVFDGTVYEKKKAPQKQIISAPTAEVTYDTTQSVPQGAVVSSVPVVDAPVETAPVSILPEQQAAAPVFDAPAAEPVQQKMSQDAATGEPTMVAPSWHGARGQTLRDVLNNWSEVAGVDLYWSIDYDYRLNDDIAFAGNYDEAVGKLLDNFAGIRPQPYGQLHQANDGPRVLVVKSYDLVN